MRSTQVIASARGSGSTSRGWDAGAGRAWDRSAATQSGWSRLVYAGDGRFCYEEDVLNMAHVLEDISSSGWQPTGPMHAPPRHPNRDWSIPSRVPRQ